MLNNSQALSLINELSGPSTRTLVNQDHAVVALYGSTSEFKLGEQTFVPVSIQMMYDRRINRVEDDSRLLVVITTFITHNYVEDVLSIPTSLKCGAFRLYGRLRRETCDYLLRPITGSTYVSMAVANIDMEQCHNCINKACMTIHKSCN